MLTVIHANEKTRNVKSTSIDGTNINMRAISQSDTLVNSERGFITDIVFDFDTVPLERVYLAAAEFALIEWRRKTFKKSTLPESEVSEPIDVSGYLPSVKLSAKEQASNFILENVSKEELIAMLEKMETQDNE